MSALDKLNLRPQERRYLVVIFVVIFVVLQVWLVWPHYNDWQIYKNKLSQTERNLKKYQAEVTRIPTNQARLKELQSSGTDVLSQELDLDRIVRNQSIASGVNISRSSPRPSNTGATRTNQFFEEQILAIECSTGGKELVDFLVNLAAGNSMIRVREMSLKPDPTQTKLLGSLTFVASYQKKNPGPALAPKTVVTPAAKTSAPPAKATPAKSSPSARPTNAPPAAPGNLAPLNKLLNKKK